jgi:hypothetical protein
MTDDRMDQVDPPSARVVAALLREARSVSRRADKLGRRYRSGAGSDNPAARRAGQRQHRAAGASADAARPAGAANAASRRSSTSDSPRRPAGSGHELRTITAGRVAGHIVKVLEVEKRPLSRAGRRQARNKHAARTRRARRRHGRPRTHCKRDGAPRGAAVRDPMRNARAGATRASGWSTAATKLLHRARWATAGCASLPKDLSLIRPKWMIAELSNYLGNNHPAQRHIYVDVHGRQTCCELRKCAGPQLAQVASGRRGHGRTASLWVASRYVVEFVLDTVRVSAGS